MEKEENESMKETYEITQEQYEVIAKLSGSDYPFFTIVNEHSDFIDFIEELPTDIEFALARYLGGDERVRFVVKEQRYEWVIYGDGVRYAITKFSETKNSLLTGSYGITDMSKSIPSQLTQSEVVDLGFEPTMFSKN